MILRRTPKTNTFSWSVIEEGINLTQLFLTDGTNISTLWNKASYPPVRVLHQSLFPRVVRMCKIYPRVEEDFQFSPTGKRNIVVCGDTFDGNTTEDFGERGTNNAALSVW